MINHIIDMKIKLTIFSIISLLWITSCESMLDINSISEITAKDYWKNENDVDGYMIGIYSKFRGANNTTLYGEDRGDALTVGVVGGVSNAWKNQMSVSTGYNWLTFYELIHHCNLLIKYASGIDFVNQKKKDRLLAEAYFVRAKTYLTLIQSWGDVPMVLEPTESDKENYPERKKATEVMELIMADIATALDLMSDETIADKNKISKPAVYCLQAEALAWKYKVLKSNDVQDLHIAIAAIEKVEASGVSLLEDFAKIFDNENKKNKEIIFSIFLKVDEYEGMYASRSSTAVIYVNTAINKEDVPYSNSGKALHNYAPSNKVKSALAVYANDKRKNASYIDALKADGGILLTSQNKFRGYVYPVDRCFDDDIIVYRLADMLLLKAELLADLGGENIAKAIAELNKVRGRAGIGDYNGAMNQANVQVEVLEERGRELFMELKRWPDLMRAHYAGVINIYTYVPNLKEQNSMPPLYFPIIQSMMDLNPKLKQTEGY